jgi:hypothetical protein
MFDENDEDLIKKVDLQLETLLPYYRKIEILAGNVIMNIFGGNVEYGLEISDQKRFDCYYEDYQLLCFLDGYQEKNDIFNIFETKATTDRKYLDLGYKENKIFNSIFEKTENNFLYLKENFDSNLLSNKKYLDNRNKLFDKYSSVGKYVYDLAFQRYVIEKSNNRSNLDKAKYFLVVLNSDYIFDGQYDQLNEPIYDDSIISFIDLTDITKELIPILEKDIKLVVEYLNNMEAHECSKGKYCQPDSLRKCQFYDICFKDVPKKNSVFSYMMNHFGFGPDKLTPYDLINEKIFNITDLPYEWLTRDINIIQSVSENIIPYTILTLLQEETKKENTIIIKEEE